MRDLEGIKGSRIYGRRQGPALSAARQARLDAMLPKLAIATPGAAPVSPGEYFLSPSRDYWLEIGFGKGEHLAALAKTHPDIGMIGCEPFLNGVSGLVDLVDSEGLENIRIFTDDARLLMDSLPDGSIGRAFVLFPDPWPKARHHKRRMICPGNIVVLSRIMRDGAELRIATDHMEYCRWIMAHMLENRDFIWISNQPDDWRTRPDDWPGSRYEIKSLAEGRKSSYLRFVRRRRRG